MISSKHLIVAALFLFAVGWIGIMGLLGAATTETVASRSGPFSDDGSIKAEITHLAKKDFHITLTLKVNDANGKLVEGLDPVNFETSENGKPVHYGNFVQAGNAPVRMCLVIDYSNSMQGRKIEGAKAAALALLANLRNSTDYLGLYFFNGKTDGTEVLPMGPLDPARRHQAEEAIKNTPLSGGTPMLGCMDRALKALESVPGKRVMVVMTDGADTGGPNAQNVIKPRVIENAKKTGVPLHMVALETGGKGGKGGGRGNNERAMRELADPTGGKYHFAPSPDDLKGIYASIGNELKNEYVIEYDSPTPVEDGVTRNVEVIVRRNDKGTRVKTSYAVSGVVATGAAARTSTSEGTPAASPPFWSVLMPLGMLLSGLLGVPYYMWLRPKS